MRRLLSTLLLTAVLLTLAACGPSEPPGSTSGAQSAQSGGADTSQTAAAAPFTLAIYPEFSIHPALASNRANLTLSPLLYESLFTVDEAFQASPQLCERYFSSEDKLTWTFVLRSGITFSDGTPLTGQVVADALNLARGEQSRYAQRLAQVTAVTASAETPDTVVITLSRPNGSLPLLLDIPIALGEGDRPLGTGPFVLTGTGEELSLTARSGWWQGKQLPLQSIPLHCVDKSDELIYAFDAGDVSLVDVDLMATNAMGYRGNYQTWDYATTDFLYLGFNTQRGPCRSSAARRAISLAIDRESLAQTSYASHAVPTALPVHPDSPLHDQMWSDRFLYNPEVLASQLEELDLAGKNLTLLVNSENTGKVSAAQRITYQLQAAGLTVTLEQLPFADFTAALVAGDFDLYLGETVLTADFDLSPLLSSSGALNYGLWRDTSTDALIAAMAASSQEDKPRAASTLFAYLDEQVPIAPLAFKNGSVLTQWGRISGLNPVRGNPFYELEHWNLS